MPGMKWSTVLLTPSMGMRCTADQVAPLVDVARTMSLAGQPVRNLQSCHVRYTVPAASISALGSGSERNPPATLWSACDATRTLEPHVAPPSDDTNERIWLVPSDQ